MISATFSCFKLKGISIKRGEEGEEGRVTTILDQNKLLLYKFGKEI